MNRPVVAAAFLALGVFLLTPPLPASAGDDKNNVTSGDNIVSLTDEPADDDELGNESGTPPQSASSGLNLPPTQTTDPVASTPGLGSGGISTYSGDTTGISLSTVSATITNNEFHN